MSKIVGLGTANASQVLSGQTFTSGSGAGQAGSMPNNGALGTITPGTANQAIPAGYTSGGTVAGDANLVAGNIVNGASIFGVTGNGGVKYATGSGTTDSSGNCIVNGLSFQPSTIIVEITHSSVVFRASYVENGDSISNGFVTESNTSILSNNKWTVSASGFEMSNASYGPDWPSSPFNYYAYE